MKNSSKLRQLLQLRPKRGRRKEKIIGQIWFSEQKNVNEEMVGLRVIGE
jgi:endonuclease YncB( thermonuclease family)